MINNRYIIKHKLGEGRSSVFLCKDVEFPEKDLAIKILSPSADIEEEQVFIEEFFSLRKLNHPNIIQANNKGTVVRFKSEKFSIERGSKFFTLEYFKGKDLLAFPLRKREQLEEIIKQLCSVLYYLHQSNYIYYDLKPENVLVGESGNKINIKLIDFGFAKAKSKLKKEVRGTAEYIAPEIIKNEPYDYQVDIYSLGMLLYRIVYDKFPFERKNELEIYKAHIEKKFDFPAVSIFPGMEMAIERLLKKNPEERFQNSLQLLDYLSIPIDESVTGSFTPAKVFAGRKDAQNILKRYLSDKASGEVFTVKGSKGAGKTTLLNELYFEFPQSILVTNRKSTTGYKFIKGLLKRIIFNEKIYRKLPEELLNKIDLMGDEPSQDFVEEIKSIFTQLSFTSKFILLLDDFNQYDDFSYEILKELIPIFQVNKIKVILGENSDINYLSDQVHNLREINLTPFTEAHLNEYLDKSFFNHFPKEEVKKLILLYADLLPGNLDGFIKDLLLLNIIKYLPDGIIIEAGESVKHLLQSSQEDIYKLRVDSLLPGELVAAQLLAAFSISLEPRVAAKILNKPLEEIYSILEKLQQKNIIQQFRINTNPNFTSDGLKNYIYDEISSKEEYHLNITERLVQKFPGFNNNELSRHYELAQNYEQSYKILMKEYSSAEKFSTYSYQKRILEHLAGMPLKKENMLSVKKELARVYYKLSECKPALHLIKELLKENLNEETENQLTALWASCLIALGDLDSGLKLYKKLLPKIKNNKRKQSVITDIAHVEFDINNYSEASALCAEVIDEEISTHEDKGKCYNLLGLIDIFRDNNLSGALSNFEEAELFFEKANLKYRLSQMEMNLGNIYNLKGEFQKAEQHWQKSLEINLSIGSLEQEAKLLLNFGIFYYDQAQFEKSINNYIRAENIFISLGNRHGQGLVLSNLGEIYILTCEYEKAVNSLLEARGIFKQLRNLDEESVTIFLLGKLHVITGNNESFLKIIKEFEKIVESPSTGERHKNNYNFLKVLNASGEDLQKIYQELKKIRGNYLEAEDKHNYFYSNIIFSEVLIKQKKFKAAFDELCEKEFQKIASINPLYNAERFYMLGKLSRMDPSLGLRPAIDIHKEAYEIIKDLSITELTWKIMLALAIGYVQRGNLTKAKEYIIYTKALLKFISDKFSPALKDLYLNEPERKQALAKTGELEKQYS